MAPAARLGENLVQERAAAGAKQGDPDAVFFLESVGHRLALIEGHGRVVNDFALFLCRLDQLGVGTRLGPGHSRHQ